MTPPRQPSCHVLLPQLHDTIQCSAARYAEHLVWCDAGAAPAVAGGRDVCIVVAAAPGARLLLRSAGRPGAQAALHLWRQVHLRIAVKAHVPTPALACWIPFLLVEWSFLLQAPDPSQTGLSAGTSRNFQAICQRRLARPSIDLLLLTCHPSNKREPGTALLDVCHAQCENTWWYAACTGEPDCSSAASLLDAASSSAQ